MPRLLMLLLVALLSAVTTAAAENHLRPELTRPSPVDALIDGYVETGALPFLYVRLEDRDGRVIYEHGSRNAELVSYEVDGDSWIRIWSMSKIVTITTVMDLVEAGIIGLDDPVTDYVPEFEGLRVAVGPDGQDLVTTDPEARVGFCPLATRPLVRPLTVRNLLNHRDGLYYPWSGVPCLDSAFRAADLSTSRDTDEFVARIAALPLINQPGSDDYYGTGTTVLGMVAERATGKTLKQLVEERVTGPLGISGLRYGLPDGDQLPPRFSGADGVLREAHDGELDIYGAHVPGYEPGHALFLGGEGMIGTADGYADFARMLLRRGELNGHRLLEEETIREMTAPHTQTDSEWGYNGYNLWISNGRLSDGSFGPGPLWVGGGYEGTQFWIDPERQLVGVLMTQIYRAPPGAANAGEAIRMALYEQMGWRSDTSPGEETGAQ
jgi:CubicO group peptidase (beta-lactamase class C family)